MREIGKIYNISRNSFDTCLEKYPIILTTSRSARSIDHFHPHPYLFFYATATTVNCYAIYKFGRSASSVTRTIKDEGAFAIADWTKISVIRTATISVTILQQDETKKNIYWLNNG